MLPFLTLQSAVSITSTRASKRSREIAWCDLLEEGRIPATEYNTPYHFGEMNQLQQEHFLTRMGFEQREKDQLKTRLREALESKLVPSPSAMKWSDVSAILHGELPNQETPLHEPPDVTCNVFTDAILESIMNIMLTKFRRLSEMEVIVRVFLMVMIAVSDKSDIRVELQPSLKNHATFTDFIIWITNKVGEVRFIEVKRTGLSVDLTTEEDSTAQGLREAQIVLCNHPDVKSLPFALTNGVIWTFGTATKHSASKIMLESVYNVNCSIATLSGWKLAIKYLTAFLYGTWPPLAPLPLAQPEL